MWHPLFSRVDISANLILNVGMLQIFINIHIYHGKTFCGLSTMDHSTFAVLKGTSNKRDELKLYFCILTKKKQKKKNTKKHTNKNNLIKNDVSEVSFELSYHVRGAIDVIVSHKHSREATHCQGHHLHVALNEAVFHKVRRSFEPRSQLCQIPLRTRCLHQQEHTSKNSMWLTWSYSVELTWEHWGQTNSMNQNEQLNTSILLSNSFFLFCFFQLEEQKCF